MATDFYKQSRDQQCLRLDAMKGTEERVSFCTNVMLDRGTVYDCAINAEGDAIVKAARSWWSRSFAPAPEHVDRNLGPVSVAIIPGTLQYCLVVGGLREGRG